jgi:hypothetical protein
MILTMSNTLALILYERGGTIRHVIDEWFR